MRTSVRRGLLLCGIVIVVVIAAALLFALWPTRTHVIAANAQPDASVIERGRYVATVGDCTACHTVPGRAPFSGGLGIASPIGVIYTTNITPDKDTGIGRLSLDQFDRAVRHGIGPRGKTMYPAMPYPSYARLSDEDLAALYAYFMNAVSPVRTSKRENGIPWPLSVRWPLAIWRKTFAPVRASNAFNGAGYSDAEVARGAYLVQGAGHCGSCHTPRALTLQEKALDESGSAYLAGGAAIDGWVPVNLRGDLADGLGRWTADDIVSSLRSARNAGHAVIGSPMSDVVVHSTQHMTEADLRAIAAYLKTLPARSTPVATFTENPQTAQALAAGHEPDRGAELYVDNCAACHRTSGLGAPGVFPAIAGNSSVLAADPESIVRLILQGSSLPATAAAPSALGMPGFGWRLSDAEVAALATFVRQSWGNGAPGVNASAVRKIRAAR